MIDAATPVGAVKVAQLVDSNFTVNTTGLVWNQMSASPPNWDAYCGGRSIYSPSGSGCALCPFDHCSDDGT